MTLLPKRAAAWMTSAMFAAACGGSATPGGGGGLGPSTEGGVEASGDGGTDSLAPQRDAQTDDGSSQDSSLPVDAPAESGPVDSGSRDVVDEPDAGFVEATHTLPIVTNNGGPVVASPLLVTVTYADDTSRSTEEAIGSFLVQSSWLATAGAEYGVGKGTSANVELTQNAPAAIDDATIQSFLAGLIQAGTAPDPVADAGAGEGGTVRSNAIYMIYFPTTTAVTVAGQNLCQYSAGGYHYESSVDANGHSFAYAVVSPCPGGVPASPPDNIVWTSSHELIEACTDPFVISAPGFALFDNTQPWSFIGGEVGDLCTYVLPQWSEGPYTAIQRVYSNAAAAAGAAPCVPAPGTYYGVDGEPSTFVAVAAGQQTVFQLTGWSTSALPPWSVTTYALAVQGTVTPTVTLGASSLQNGQKTTLTVGIPAGTPSNTYLDVLLQSSFSTTSYTTSVVGVYVP